MTSQRTRERLVARLARHGIRRDEVLNAVRQTPRHLFLDEVWAHRAYEDTPLPIGSKQTISQPFIVACMTEMILDAEIAVKKVLEIGTGCGYQTAILAQTVKWVFTIERIASLQARAQSLLPQLGYRNVSYLNGDGFLGWESNQPFDGILVTAAPPHVPEALRAQLQIGGRLVIPIGENEDAQNLRIITRTKDGFTERVYNAVRFVPMLHGQTQ